MQCSKCGIDESVHEQMVDDFEAAQLRIKELEEEVKQSQECLQEMSEHAAAYSLRIKELEEENLRLQRDNYSAKTTAIGLLKGLEAAEAKLSLYADLEKAARKVDGFADMLNCWADYASEYFKEKHKFSADILLMSKVDDALAALKED